MAYSNKLTRDKVISYITKSKLLGAEVQELSLIRDIPEIYLIKTHTKNSRGYVCKLIIPDDVTEINERIYDQLADYTNTNDTLYVVGGSGLDTCEELFKHCQCQIYLDDMNLSGLASPTGFFSGADMHKFNKRAYTEVLDYTKFRDISSLFSYAKMPNANIIGLDLSNIISMDYMFSDTRETPRPTSIAHSFNIINNTTNKLRSIIGMCENIICKDLVVRLNTERLKTANSAFRSISVDSLILDIGSLNNVVTYGLFDFAKISNFILICLPDDCKIEDTLENFEGLKYLNTTATLVLQNTTIYGLEENAEISSYPFTKYIDRVPDDIRHEMIYRINEYIINYKQDYLKNLLPGGQDIPYNLIELGLFDAKQKKTN